MTQKLKGLKREGDEITCDHLPTDIKDVPYNWRLIWCGWQFGSENDEVSYTIHGITRNTDKTVMVSIIECDFRTCSIKEIGNQEFADEHMAYRWVENLLNGQIEKRHNISMTTLEQKKVSKWLD